MRPSPRTSDFGIEGGAGDGTVQDRTGRREEGRSKPWTLHGGLLDRVACLEIPWGLTHGDEGFLQYHSSERAMER